MSRAEHSERLTLICSLSLSSPAAEERLGLETLISGLYIKLLKISLSSSKEVNFYCAFSIVVNLIGQMLFRLTVVLFRNSFCGF